MAKFFRGDKRRREMDRKRRGEEKARRLQFRREMRAKGLDPDTVDAEGNPLPLQEGAGGELLPGEPQEDSEAGPADDPTATDSTAAGSGPGQRLKQ